MELSDLSRLSHTVNHVVIDQGQHLNHFQRSLIVIFYTSGDVFYADNSGGFPVKSHPCTIDRLLDEYSGSHVEKVEKNLSDLEQRGYLLDLGQLLLVHVDPPSEDYLRENFR